MKQLILLSHHPHLQTEDQSWHFFTEACDNLKYIEQYLNRVGYSRCHFPKLNNYHQQVIQVKARDPTLMR